MEAAATFSLLDAVLGTDGLTPVFQPIVDLADGRVVGYEALARGPVGSALHSPAELFGAAHDEGRMAELDIACQTAALRHALNGHLAAPLSVFVNIEPDASGPLPEALRTLYATACARFRVVVEVTERALTARPADLLARVADMRALGCAIALDDVGADTSSLAMMSLLEPDVIKLDLGLVQRAPDIDVAHVVSAVGAEAERTGAVILVEGIETEAHLEAAIGMGGVLAQGWHFGRPGPLPSARIVPAISAIAPQRHAARVRTPFQLATGLRTRVSTKPLLFAMSRHIENQALASLSPTLILSTFQAGDYMTAGTRRRYVGLAEATTYCAVLGVDMDPEPAPGVHGVALRDDDPLADEWDIAVVSPYFACALVALDLLDEGPDEERRFEYVVSYDRSLVIPAAQALMARITSR